MSNLEMPWTRMFPSTIVRLVAITAFLVATILVATILVAGAAAPEVAGGSDGWPQFQGPRGDGVTSQSLPTHWSPDSNIAWRSELPGTGWSSPVVSGDRVYLTTAIEVAGQDNDLAHTSPAKGTQESDQKLSLLIVDAKRGQLIKSVAVMDQTSDRRSEMHSKNSHASPTPVLDGDRIFVHFGYQGTACLTTNGDPIWINRDLYFHPTHGNGGSPILVGNRLIFTCDGDTDPKVVALDADTGSMVWQVRRPVTAKKTFSFCTPSVISVDGKTQVIAPGSDCVLALDPATGETIWDFRYEGYSVVPKPVFDLGLVILSTGFDRPKMLAIQPTGHGLVSGSHLQWQVDKNVPKTPSMIAHDGLVHSISDDGIAMCVDAQSGDVLYRERIGGNFSSSLLLAGEHVYMTSEQGVTTVIKAGREFDQIAENDLGERTLSSMAVVDDSILLRTANALYRIGN